MGSDGAALEARVAARLRAAGVAAGDVAVVAVSGGADSVALLRLCAALRGTTGPAIVVAHLHHGLRGAEADGDAAFVAALARSLDVPVRVERVDATSLARASGVSVEMAGREARRRFLAEVAAQHGARWRVLAHHADDQVETVLLRLARGTGLGGAGGMAPVTPDGIVRPLLGERRSDLVAYLRAIGQPWREDRTNADPGAAERNALRHHVVPALVAARAGAVEQVARAARHLRDDADLLRSAVNALMAPVVRVNGGPWQRMPGDLWRSASLPLRRQLLREGARAVAGRYPPANWTEAWAGWPEARAARPDLTWLRLAAWASDVFLFVPARAEDAPSLPAGDGWHLALPDGATIEAVPGSRAAGGAAVRAAPGLVARRAAPGDRVADTGQPVRERLAAAGVPAPCRSLAWVVAAGPTVVWLPRGGRDEVALDLGPGQAAPLVWRAPGPATPPVAPWPQTGGRAKREDGGSGACEAT